MNGDNIVNLKMYPLYDQVSMMSNKMVRHN